MGFEERLSRLLAERRKKGLYRQLPIDISKKHSLDSTRERVNLAGNDYLGLSQHPAVKEACSRAAHQKGSGNCASRLLSGNHPDYFALENSLANWLDKKVLIFGSGFLANVGILSCIAGRKDMFFADKLVHRSIIEGMRLSGAKIERFAHNDFQDLARLLQNKRERAENAFIVTEALFSMTGTSPAWKKMAALKRKFDCSLYVDEAHSIGVWGAQGKGLAQQAGFLDEIDIMIGTFGKGWGNYGAFFAGKKIIKEYLVNFAPSFIYSTALPPSVLAGIQAAFEIIKSPEGENLRKKLQKNIQYFSAKWDSLFLERKGEYQIQALVAGNTSRLMSTADYLKDQGYSAAAIRPPTVPDGMQMIRLSLNASLSQHDIEHLILKLHDFCPQ